MLIDKYIFVIFLSLFVIIGFRGKGVGSKVPRILKSDIFQQIFAKRLFS